jgi:hypothetical protein
MKLFTVFTLALACCSCGDGFYTEIQPSPTDTNEYQAVNTSTDKVVLVTIKKSIYHHPEKGGGGKPTLDEVNTFNLTLKPGQIRVLSGCYTKWTMQMPERHICIEYEVVGEMLSE